MYSGFHVAAAILTAAIAHKILLLGSLFASSEIWDTSTRILFSSIGTWQDKLAARLMAWDNVHFIAQVQNDGPRYEHEYAFSRYWALLIRRLSPYPTLTACVLTAATLSLICHVINAFLVEFAGEKLLKASNSAYKSPLAAFMYIIHPAGIFLISGYTESAFATMILLGILCIQKRQYVLAGIAVAAATLLRSNGLIWGLLFVNALYTEFIQSSSSLSTRIRNSVGVLVGGSLVFFSFAYTQYAAYVEFCPGLRWCDNTIPSIYLYVQEHYWQNGLFRYWTVSNLPLFLLALPTLVLLLRSSIFLYHRGQYAIMWVQMIMFFGAIFFWHVQIVTRLVSCTPGPSWYIADQLQKRNKSAKWWVVFFILWTSAQAALYGAFLPPA